MLSDERKELLALYGVSGIGSKTHARLLERFGSPRAVFGASAAELMEMDGIGEKTASSILRFDRGRFIREQETLMEKCGAVMLTRTDPEYPPLLKLFKSAPPVLFVRGEVSALGMDMVAFVGTRRLTDYGSRMSRKLVSGAVSAGLCVVSGMAAGVDTASHRAALDSGGKTVAVFGCGVDVIYPSGNRKLAGEIEKSGCLVSHFPMGTPALAGNFPARNAVVVGMSQGTVVVEAPEQSGALITAELTLRAGRPLMAVPGNVDSPTCAGTNTLLKNGARPVLAPEDILRELGMKPVPGTARPGRPVPPVQVVPLPEGLAGEILKVLAHGPLQVEEISEKLANPISAILNELTMLEMDGLIFQKPGKIFERRG